MLHQLRIDPVPLLTADVNCFWTLEQDQESYNRRKFVPDSYIEVLINVGAPLLLEMERGLVELPRAFVNPIQNKPLRFRTTGYCQTISMKAYPWAVKPILNVAADPSSVHVIGLDAGWQRFADDLTRIVAHQGYEEAINAFQDYVCKMAYRGKHDVTPIRTAGHLLRHSRGQIRMTDLAAQSYLSSSQFERRFKQYTAVSPKTYARIIRFEAVRAALISEPASRLADLANHYGYSDQAHLIREFRAFAHCTPRDFTTIASTYLIPKNVYWSQFQMQSPLVALPA
ncbi:MAG: AraC family transcriptional regulator [Anaerolineae bacterium]